MVKGAFGSPIDHKVGIRFWHSPSTDTVVSLWFFRREFTVTFAYRYTTE